MSHRSLQDFFSSPFRPSLKSPTPTVPLVTAVRLQLRPWQKHAPCGISLMFHRISWIKTNPSPISRIVKWCKDVCMKHRLDWQPPPRSPVILGGVLCVVLWAYAVISARQMTEGLIVAATEVQVQIAEQVRLIGIILQRSSELERKARLVILLSDPSIREPYETESYEKSRAAYQKSMDELARLVLDPEVTLIVQELIEQESLIHRQMEALEGHSNVPPSLDQAFADFSERTMTLAMRLDAEARGALVKNVNLSRRQLKDYQIQNGMALLSVLILIALVYAWTKRFSHPPALHDDP